MEPGPNLTSEPPEEVHVTDVRLGTGERDEPTGVEAPRVAKPVFSLHDVGVAYGGNPAVERVTFDLREREITAFIGPSGCGKSTLIRCLNRMNDLIPSASVTGRVLYHDQDLYDRDIDPVQVRKRIGMVFQKPNPFPK